MMVDASEPEIFERDAAEHVDQLVLSIAHRLPPILDTLEDGAYTFVIHSTVLGGVLLPSLSWFDLGTTELYRECTSVLADAPPMTTPDSLLLGLYFAILVCLSIYGLHRCYLVYLYTKYRHTVHVPPASDVGSRTSGTDTTAAPFVTVQLPIYNEMYVVERLIDAVACLEYPRDRLEIQVLDDSTDETRQIARAAVDRMAARGLDIHYIHRTHRTGFKAGALKAGLERARGELIAIFDADFVPPVDFLSLVLPSFLDTRVGMVQTRWGHLNRDYSLLTRVQSMFLDAHFVLEHGARSRGGLFFNFNGTAGVWRRAAITSAGGWQHDTLTEDLDLSYRAQLAGWRFVFLQDVVAPAEVPVEMNGFKAQQYRWARGSVQTGLKVLPAVCRARLPMRVKIEAFFHLTAHLNYPLLLLLSLVMVPALFVRVAMGSSMLLLVDFPLFCVATLSVVNFYAVSQYALRTNWLAQLRYIPLLMAVGIGLSVNNTWAVLRARSGRGALFERTPKYGVVRRGDEWLTKRYRLSKVAQPVAEIGLGLYYTAAVAYTASTGLLEPLPFLCLFQVGFLYTGLQSIWQRHAEPDPVLQAQIAGE